MTSCIEQLALDAINAAQNHIEQAKRELRQGNRHLARLDIQLATKKAAEAAYLLGEMA